MSILARRLRTERRFHPGEETLIALGVAAGEVGAVVERVLRDHGLTHTRYNVLRILRGAGGGGISCADIGDRLLVPSPDVTRLVDPLVTRGWVERDRWEEDRRVVIQRLTTAGHRLLTDLEAPLARVHQALARGLGPGAVDRLVGLCEEVMEMAASGRLDPEPILAAEATDRA